MAKKRRKLKNKPATVRCPECGLKYRAESLHAHVSGMHHRNRMAKKKKF
jgi:hypothetical protein